MEVVEQAQRLRELEGERLKIEEELAGSQGESREIDLVLAVLKDLEPTRRCWREVGGIMVERTVDEVRDSLEKRKVALGEVTKALEARRSSESQKFNELMEKMRAS